MNAIADMDGGGLYQQAQGTPLDMSLPENQQSAIAVLGIVGALLGAGAMINSVRTPSTATYKGPAINPQPAKPIEVRKIETPKPIEVPKIAKGSPIDLNEPMARKYIEAKPTY